MLRVLKDMPRLIKLKDKRYPKYFNSGSNLKYIYIFLWSDEKNFIQGVVVATEAIIVHLFSSQSYANMISSSSADSIVNFQCDKANCVICGIRLLTTDFFWEKKYIDIVLYENNLIYVNIFPVILTFIIHF